MIYTKQCARCEKPIAYTQQEMANIALQIQQAKWNGFQVSNVTFLCGPCLEKDEEERREMSENA